jgi:signal transduction histidine kinase
MQWQILQFREYTGIEVTFEYPPDLTEPTVPVATCLYRILQEGLTNISRHASATRVRVSLQQVSGSLHLIITDDGRGFDNESLQKRGSFGILGMKERVASLQGEFEFTGSPGKGTRLVVRIPCQASG